MYDAAISCTGVGNNLSRNKNDTISKRPYSLHIQIQLAAHTYMYVGIQVL